ncbi:bifunctional UDP-N-acetylglucosamine diphosphorylase/glucosamine-1-phosphate N-acetyltransferase GlmU [Oxalobacter aliiformigenes]|uniref:Bifunctional protein GlmU n=1 Tax=Oxalobacter aliiformigenes TaxID=2946593 RepID=A0ABY7JIB3_9BURK|nr:bifunctional UDP-N-acetylglucosamine diphosphorylase/glucosamine-1-phosphate N-acetyltransferase GlmU [Oxalobacter aliiformigenes]WAV93635.1 bifunctional UDP-N-acetylglucosamine diphosphorylase/glucosamine-1-phosphate N-acetyltransferase GlmU [Oxalobacter aliiformigenes]WAV94863.1 bifunctional UDP-N-acetylglucosamine diphosphorylase/glucosamine-1-phosphate N-acetyltransferase GlmU [Oxalobacter aliiformigenes]WAV97329.1 bifunctional UDP-N-acetylglucosamine diphosphorylase/glucosamine-1-phospha
MNIVILAAGMGKRMHSSLPKVLHLLAGKSMLEHVIATARALMPEKLVIVYGYGGEQVLRQITGPDLIFVKQEPQLGTGHAVMQAVPELDESVPTLILYGDVPLIGIESLRRLVSVAGNERLGILTVEMPDPTGYGRIIRVDGRIRRIVEQKDGREEELAVKEINTGMMVVPTALLKRWLSSLTNDNVQGEYYLTDIVSRAVSENIDIVSSQPDDISETMGVNSKKQLAKLERVYQKNIASRLLDDGVSLADPDRIDVRGSLQCGRDVFIDVNSVFEGEVTLADGVTVGPNCVVRNCLIGENAEIRPFCHLDGAKIGPGSLIGPYARLRPGAELGEEVHIGNFVEVKNSHIAAQSKANHLAYVGDSTVGSRVNIGAGAITCNYDGANKHRTVIGDDAFIGTNCELVAPVRVGSGATIGAGTTLTKDAPAGSLTVSRVRQTTINDWKRPVKSKK